MGNKPAIQSYDVQLPLHSTHRKTARETGKSGGLEGGVNQKARNESRLSGMTSYERLRETASSSGPSFELGTMYFLLTPSLLLSEIGPFFLFLRFADNYIVTVLGGEKGTFFFFSRH